jgi:hypothetical protein
MYLHVPTCQNPLAYGIVGPVQIESDPNLQNWLHFQSTLQNCMILGVNVVLYIALASQVKSFMVEVVE